MKISKMTMGFIVRTVFAMGAISSISASSQFDTSGFNETKLAMFNETLKQLGYPPLPPFRGRGTGQLTDTAAVTVSWQLEITIIIGVLGAVCVILVLLVVMLVVYLLRKKISKLPCFRRFIDTQFGRKYFPEWYRSVQRQREAERLLQPQHHQQQAVPMVPMEGGQAQPQDTTINESVASAIKCVCEARFTNVEQILANLQSGLIEVQVHLGLRPPPNAASTAPSTDSERAGPSAVSRGVTKAIIEHPSADSESSHYTTAQSSIRSSQDPLPKSDAQL